MLKNMVESERKQKIWRLRVAHSISKPTKAQAHAEARATTPTPPHARTHIQQHAHIDMAPSARASTHTHTEICNAYCFSQQLWFRERASVLRQSVLLLCVCVLLLYVACRIRTD